MSCYIDKVLINKLLNRPKHIKLFWVVLHS